jgi:hypothetical protein
MILVAAQASAFKVGDMLKETARGGIFMASTVNTGLIIIGIDIGPNLGGGGRRPDREGCPKDQVIKHRKA